MCLVLHQSSSDLPLPSVLRNTAGLSALYELVGAAESHGVADRIPQRAEVAIDPDVHHSDAHQKGVAVPGTSFLVLCCLNTYTHTHGLVRTDPRHSGDHY